ncbi:MAG: DUF1697 domain-containing protein [Thermoanaerobaculaceae bacterium]|nr:DUF1697 domain-containing protein [Thermoanaerobaculaceae bacterium]
MTAHIALLRGINVGGRKKVAMGDLRALLRDLGLADPHTLLQSGNLVFRDDGRDGAHLEELLQREAGRRLGLDTEIFVRSAREWRAIIAGNPFRAEASRDPGHLLVLLLKAAPDAAKAAALRAAITGPEQVDVRGRHAYAVYPRGIGRSRLTNALVERTLGTRATGRNWNTVLELAALAGG